MINIASCLLSWINAKGYYYQACDKNHNMPEIAIFVDNCSCQNKNIVLIRFMKMIKEVGFFGTATLNLYIKGHTKNECDRAFNSLKVLYQKQHVFNFENCCRIWNTSNNVGVTQMFHEMFLTWNHS